MRTRALVVWRVLLAGLIAAACAGGGAVAAGPRPGGEASRPSVLVLGDSLAAGYGVELTEAFPALLQARVDAAGLGFEVVNAGVSGDTTAGGLRRLAWLLRRPPEVLVVELGGNDGLRGLSPAATRSNLVAIIETARAKVPGLGVVLAGMQMPPNMGLDYAREYREVFPAVARQLGIPLIPHLLEGVGGRPELNQADLIHPTPEGHRVVAENVWKILGTVLEKRARAGSGAGASPGK